MLLEHFLQPLSQQHIATDSSSTPSIAYWFNWDYNILFTGCQAKDDCNLLGRVGIAVQVGITIVCAVVFLAVWFCETPRRPFLTWLFDISKQVVGAAYGKLYNIAQSVIFAEWFRVSLDHQDQCVWYLMSISLDCFFLTFLLWGANSFMRPILLERFGIDIGEYDESIERRPSDTDSVDDKKSENVRELCPPGQVRQWLVQVGIWLSIITVVRLFMSTLLFFVQQRVYEFHADIFTALGLVSRTSKLIFAVLIYPIFADTFQIVVQDSFLKKHKSEVDT
jgi:Na+/melibiose symporter-like transporter